MMIEVKGLSKLYSEVAALKEISFTVAEGEIVGLLGPFGSGRSTLIKILATLTPPSGGEARIGGLSVTGQAEEVRRIIGYQASFFGAYEDMRVWDYLEFFGLTHHGDPDRLAGRLERLLELAGLADKRNEYIGALDQEMRQRLGVVKTLVHDPPVLLLDEPAVGLAPAARRRLRGLIGEVQRLGRTILVTSNLLTDLTGLCHRLGLLQRGRLVALGPAEAIAGQVVERRVIELKIQGDAGRARELVKAYPQVSRAEARGEILLFRLNQALQDPAEVVEELRRQGIPVTAYREHEIDLEGFVGQGRATVERDQDA